MNSPIADAIGLNSDLFHWVVVPIGIFLARIVDVSINTLRTVLMLGGRKRLAPIFGFFEALIWLIAIGQIMKNLDSIFSYLAYAGGFASGILVGMILEEKLAFGKVIVRVITGRGDAKNLIQQLKNKGYSLTIVPAEGGRGGKVFVLFSVINRTSLPEFKKELLRWDDGAFFSVEAVRYASERTFGAMPEEDEDEQGAGHQQEAHP